MKELRLVLLGLAAVFAVVLGAGFLRRAVTHAPGQATALQEPAAVGGAQPLARGSTAPASARAEVERALADSPDYTRFFDRLRLLFPSDYASIMTNLAAAAPTGEVNIDSAMTDAVVSLRRAQGGLAAKASDAALANIFALQLREMQALGQQDPHLCVAFLYGANGNDFLSFASEHRALVADSAIAGLDAMNSGRMDAVVRGAPTDADFQTLDRALVARGLSRPAIDALLDGKAANPPIPDADMCRGGQTYLETLATLPADVRDRLYGLAVDLMAKS